jgi:large subunit ribosomal protein L21
MFAVILHKNKQYRVEPGREYKVDLFDLSEQTEIIFDEVLLAGDEKETKIGDPTIKGATVTAEILGSTKGEKVSTLKFKAKKHYKRNLGHRQQYIVVKIKDIKL